MLLRFKRIFNDIQGSLWFVPLVIVLTLLVLALIIVRLDEAIGPDSTAHLPLVFQWSPEGTRDMLSTIAGTMLTVASVAFSFTIIVFSFASSQYSSRTIHSFMDDNTNQIVLGTLLGSFVYCLMVLRTVRIDSGEQFVPVLSASFALLLAMCDLALFVVFIHHVSESIQAYHIIQRVGSATCHAINSLYPPHSRGRQHEEHADNLIAQYEMVQVRATHNGYLQMVYIDHLISVANRYDLVVVLQKRVGNFVVTHEVLVLVGPGYRVSEQIARQIRDTFVTGPHRTIFQDPLYGMLQLNDIAIKALSPAINDPNTAVMALNETSKVLRLLAGRELPRHILTDKEGNPRVIAHSIEFESMVAQAFDQVRRYGMSDAIIPAKLLDVIAEVGDETNIEGQQDILKEHVLAIIEDAGRQIIDRRDRALINAELPDVIRALGMSEGEIGML